MSQTLIFVLLGVVVGTLAGLLGIGGAIFVVPILVYVFGWEQHLAQGTTLAMLIPPIGILAAWKYYQAGNIDFKVAGLLCIGFVVGGYAGGYLANQIPSEMLRRLFGVAMLLIAIKMILGK